MNNNDPHDERELPEWLQRDVDDSDETEASKRLSIGLAVLVLSIAALFGVNALLKLLGYGG